MFRPSIITDDINKAIKDKKNRRATKPDEIPTDILKLLGENGRNCPYIHYLINCNTGRLNEINFCNSIKKNTKIYGTISLMSHVLKIYLRIVYVRIREIKTVWKIT